MYLHLGSGTTVDMADIVAIMDMDTLTIAKDSREFLRSAEERGEIVTVSEDVPKSVVVCSGTENGIRVYITNISSRALAGRVRRNERFLGYSLIGFDES